MITVITYSDYPSITPLVLHTAYSPYTTHSKWKLRVGASSVPLHPDSLFPPLFFPWSKKCHSLKDYATFLLPNLIYSLPVVVLLLVATLEYTPRKVGCKITHSPLSPTIESPKPWTTRHCKSYQRSNRCLSLATIHVRNPRARSGCRYRICAGQ